MLFRSYMSSASCELSAGEVRTREDENDDDGSTKTEETKVEVLSRVDWESDDEEEEEEEAEEDDVNCMPALGVPDI